MRSVVWRVRTKAKGLSTLEPSRVVMGGKRRSHDRRSARPDLRPQAGVPGEAGKKRTTALPKASRICYRREI